MADLTFSSDRRYVFSVGRHVRLQDMRWPEIIVVPFAANPHIGPETKPEKTQASIVETHPIALERDHCFIHGELIYRAYQEKLQGTIYLDVKPVDSLDSHFRRVPLGIVPDTYLNRQRNKLFAVWPNQPRAEVLPVVIPGDRNGTPMVIRTGKLSVCLVLGIDRADFIGRNSLSWRIWLGAVRLSLNRHGLASHGIRPGRINLYNLT